MHRSRRERCTGGELLRRRPVEPQEAVGLGLEGRDRHGPEPGAATDALAAVRRVDVGRARHRARPVEALDALDRRHLREALPPRPGIDRRRLVAGVDREPGDLQLCPAGVRPGPAEQRGERVPGRLVLRSAVDDDMIDEPALQPAAPGPDVDLDAVLLHVGAGGQEQPALRHRARGPALAPVVEPPPVRRLAGLDPGLAEDGVAEGADRLVRALRRLPRPRDPLPAQPADRRVERREVEADRRRDRPRPRSPATRRPRASPSCGARRSAASQPSQA